MLRKAAASPDRTVLAVGFRWRVDGVAGTASTARALERRGLLEERPGLGRGTVYRITAAGRAALASPPRPAG